MRVLMLEPPPELLEDRRLRLSWDGGSEEI